MARRVIFVGMNPGWLIANDKGSIGRLNKWASVIGVEHYSFLNVFAYPGAFRKDQVDEGWLLATIGKCDPDALVVALGKVAHDVLSRIRVSHLTVPHPSGRNRQLNDKEFEKNMLEQLREIVHDS